MLRKLKNNNNMDGKYLKLKNKIVKKHRHLLLMEKEEVDHQNINKL
jgi:hypothetical protein